MYRVFLKVMPCISNVFQELIVPDRYLKFLWVWFFIFPSINCLGSCPLMMGEVLAIAPNVRTPSRKQLLVAVLLSRVNSDTFKDRGLYSLGLFVGGGIGQYPVHRYRNGIDGLWLWVVLQSLSWASVSTVWINRNPRRYFEFCIQ